MSRPALVVAERMALVRDGLLALLSPSWPVGAVRAAETLERAVALAGQVPDCVLVLDSQLLAGGMAAVRARLPLAGIIVLTGAEEGGLAHMEAGAHGLVGKADGSAELLRAVAVVRAGGIHVPQLLRHAAGPAVPAAEPAPARGAAQLTGRQRDVLRLLAEGRSTKDIARSMDLAVSTIKVHLAALYRTVGARNRVEALCRAGLLAG